MPNDQSTDTPPPTPDAAPYPGPHSGTPPRPTDGFFASVRRLGVTRSDDRWVGGVAAGVAQRFGIDPMVVRGLLVLTIFFSGAGLVLYGLAWALLPEERDDRIHLEQTIRGDVDIALVGAAAAVIAGFSWGGTWWSIAGHVGLGWINGVIWVAAVAGIVWLVVLAVRSASQHRTPPAGAPPYGTPPGAARSAEMPAGDVPPGDAPAPQASGSVDPARAASAATQAEQRQAQRSADRARAAQDRAEQRRAAQERAEAKRPRPAGSVTVTAVLGLLLLAGAALGWWAWSEGTDVDVLLAWIGAGLLLVGAATTLTGLRGRRAGGLHGIAWILVAVGAVVAIWGSNDLYGATDGVQRTISSDTYVPRSTAEAERGVSFGVGDARIDLTELDLSPASTGTSPTTGTTATTAAAAPIEIPVRFTAGDVTVVVPDDAAVTADVSLWAGDVTWTGGQASVDRSLIGGERTTLTSDEMVDGVEPQIALDIAGRAGTVHIEEAS